MRRAVALLVLVVVLTGCSGSQAAGPTATVPRESPPTTSADPYAVPAVIDVAYINRVLAALDHVYGDALRVLVRDRAVTPDFTTRMRSIYGDSQAQLVLDLANHIVENNFDTLAAAPGDPHTTVDAVVRTAASCIFAAVTRDLRPTAPMGSTIPTPQNYVALRPLPITMKTSPSANQTPWRIVYSGFRRDGSVPEDACSQD